MKKPILREGMKFVMAIPNGEECVRMISFEGVVLLATNKGIYVLGAQKKVNAYLKKVGWKQLAVLA